jgi:hypothetical protein
MVFCADIGSIKKGNFAWARGVPSDNGLTKIYSKKDIHDLVSAVAEDLNSGCSVAMGFECSLFVPIADDFIGSWIPPSPQGGRGK